MMENMNSIIKDKEVSELEQTLIQNLNVYKDLIDRITSIQPELCLTSILKREICWIIKELEINKQDRNLIDYKIGWAKNTLRIVCVNSRKEIMIMIVDLIRNKLFHEGFANNMRMRVIGVG